MRSIKRWLQRRCCDDAYLVSYKRLYGYELSLRARAVGRFALDGGRDMLGAGHFGGLWEGWTRRLSCVSRPSADIRISYRTAATGGGEPYASTVPHFD